MSSSHSSTRQARRWTLPAGLLLVAGFLALMAAPASASDHHVMIERYAYGPATLNIDQGDTVTWTNHDSVEHDVVVTSGPASFRSPMLSQGESWSHTFTTPGSYSYICSVHPEMRASVTAAAAAPVAPTTSAAPTPSQTTPAATTEHTAAAPAKRRTPALPSATPSPTAAQTTATPATQQQVASADLDPLLLVAGVSIAVVVFCLLLMASRPIPVAAPDDETE